jgi:hypothetical protein
MSGFVANDEGGFVIFSGTKLWYSSKETNIKAQKSSNVGKVRASAKAKRVVEFPIFDQMMEIEEDPYWKSLLDEAATGKFPRNFKFQNNVLNYKMRSKTFEQAIDPLNIKDSIDLLKKFFLDTACIQSPEDLRRKKLEEEKKISEMIQNEVVFWNQIRSEKQRMIMISLYGEILGNKYGLSVEERKGLVQNIRIGMLAGYFNSENIHISGNRIIEIKGLKYNNSTKDFEIDKDMCKLPKTKHKPVFEDYSSKSCSDLNDSSLGYDENGSDDESPGSIIESKDSSSLQSTQSLKKRWSKFLSEITKK